MHQKSSILNTESMEFKNLENVENCFKDTLTILFFVQTLK